jgi:hypothetical protein
LKAELAALKMPTQYHKDTPYPYAYSYRDWVIRAFIFPCTARPLRGRDHNVLTSPMRKRSHARQ